MDDGRNSFVTFYIDDPSLAESNVLVLKSATLLWVLKWQPLIAVAESSSNRLREVAGYCSYQE